MDRREMTKLSAVALFMCLSSGFVVSLAPGAALAQQTTQPTPNDPATIKKVLGLLKQANAHYDAKAYDKAMPLYKEAYALYPDPAMLYRIGETAEAMGQLREAAGYYDKVVAAMPDDPKVATLAKRLPGLKAKVPPLIKLTSEPAGANVYKDNLSGEPIGSTPYEAEAKVGEAIYVLRRDGYETARRVVKHEPAGQQEIHVAMVPVEGQIKQPAVSEAPSGPSKTLNRAGWITAGTGVALLGVGGVFSLLQSGKTDEVNSFDKRAAGRTPTQGRAELEDLKSQAEGYHTTSLIFYAVGGLAAAAGVGILAYDMTRTGQESAPSATAKRRSTSSPSATMSWGVELWPGGARVGVAGEF